MFEVLNFLLTLNLYVVLLLAFAPVFKLTFNKSSMKILVIHVINSSHHRKCFVQGFAHLLFVSKHSLTLASLVYVFDTNNSSMKPCTSHCLIIIIIIIIIITQIFIQDNLSVLIERTVVKRVRYLSHK